jgi:hypothetical protein
MKQYYVLYTYMANYSRTIPVLANSPEDAFKSACGMYSDDFLAKATVYVFDAPPALIVHKGERYTFEQAQRILLAYLRATGR